MTTATTFITTLADNVSQHTEASDVTTTGINNSSMTTVTTIVTLPGNVSTTIEVTDVTTMATAFEITSQTLITTQNASDMSTDSNHYYNGDYDYDYGDEYMYPGYAFERPVYLYIWEILVIFTFLVNVIVISVLLRKKMRNATNLILAAIAISDSLTGLVTLPTYIMVYQRYDPLKNHNYYGDNLTKQYPGGSNDSSHYYNGDSQSYYNSGYDYDDYANQHYSYGQSSMNNVSYQNYNTATQAPVDGYTLTRDLCRGFMISKYFLSKSFHTVSIFLTLFLGIQRYVSVAFPFKSQAFFSMQRTMICCVVIFIASPVLHSYHLFDEKAMEGLCQWELSDKGCKGGCIYLWLMFFIRHFIPCLMLVIATLLFLRELRKGEANIRRMNSNQSQISRRVDENRRITIIVTLIVIVFLIPEIPYGIFLLYNAIEKLANNGKDIHLETNRAIHMSYEILLVLSFHANFYVYTFFNRRFRKCLKGTIINPVRKMLGDPRRLSISRTSSTSQRATVRQTDLISSNAGLQLRVMNTNSSDKSATMETTKFMESFSADVTQNSRPDSNELDALTAKV